MTNDPPKVGCNYQLVSGLGHLVSGLDLLTNGLKLHLEISADALDLRGVEHRHGLELIRAPAGG